MPSLPPRADPPAGSVALSLAVDRIACTGHGICATLLPEQVGVDEWGYPVVYAAVVDPSMGDVAIRLCPARALSWARRSQLTADRRVRLTARLTHSSGTAGIHPGR